MAIVIHFNGVTIRFVTPRAVGAVGARGSFPPDFDRSVNPISTRGADYAHHSNTSPPGFSDLAMALLLIRSRKKYYLD